jgi:hypothetical protein
MNPFNWIAIEMNSRKKGRYNCPSVLATLDGASIGNDFDRLENKYTKIIAIRIMCFLRKP